MGFRGLGFRVYSWVSEPKGDYDLPLFVGLK